MRIAIIADPFIPIPPVGYGGIERIIHLLLQYLVKQGHDIVLVAHKNSDVVVPLIPFPDQELRFKHFRNTFVINKISTFKPDVIHSFGRLAYLLPVLLSKTPKIMSYQREPTISQIKKALFLSKKNSLSFTGCSNYITNKIKAVGNSTTIYNCFPLNIYEPNFAYDDDAPLVFLGRLEEIKGVHLAIETAQKSNKKLVIAGNIPKEAEPYFSKSIAPHLNDQIKYIGVVNDQQKNDLLRNSIALLMPILWEEPFGIVMIESMACGTPVIALRRGSVPEVVKENVTGYICNTVNDMVQAVSKLSLLNRMNVFKESYKRFNSNVIGKEYLDLYYSKISN